MNRPGSLLSLSAFDADGDGINEAAGVTDDPAAGGSTDATRFVVAAPAAVPMLSCIALALLPMLLALGTAWRPRGT